MSQTVSHRLSETIAVKTEIPLKILNIVLDYSIEVVLCLSLVAKKSISLSHIKTTTHVVYRNIVFWNLFLYLLKNFQSLSILMFLNEVHSKFGEQTTVSIAHTHNCLVDVEALLRKTTKLITSHHVAINLFCVVVLVATSVLSSERRDTTCKTFLNEVVTKIHVVAFAYSDSYIKRTSPVARVKHLEHHHIVLTYASATCKRDSHLVRNTVASHKHTTLLNSLFVDSEVNSICRYDVHIRIF